MHKLYQPFLQKTFTAAIIFLTLLPFAVYAQQTVEGVVRIKVSEALAAQLEQRTFSKTVSGEIVTGVQSLDLLNRELRVRHLTRVFPHAGKNELRHRKHGLHLWYEARMDKDIPLTSAIQSYQSDRQILRAEPVYQKAIIDAATKNSGPRVIRSSGKNSGAALPDASNDPLLESQWHYHNTGQTGGTPGADIRLFDAWKLETGSRDVIIAVTDGGIQTDHPDLAANMWVNTGEIAGNNLDDDNNGYVDDIHGYGFVNDSGNILPHEHGTHVAGTVAAASNNGIGVAGVAGGSGNADGARLMSCAVFAYDSVPDGFAEAYVYGADNGAVISQSSWGYTAPGVFEQVVLDAIDYFIAEAGKDEFGQQTAPMKGGIAIFSAGNFDYEGNFYPSFYEPVLAVASTTHRDTRAHYSNFGTWIDIAAPGGETDVTTAEGVVSTLPGSQYGAFMGTSMACPHVSGVAALIVSKFGKQGFTPAALRARLLQSVDNIDALNPGYEGKLGTGRLNAAMALREGNRIPPEPIADLSVSGTDVGQITLTWTSPHDEGDFVTEYDLRYATTPITETNFSAATRVENVPAPEAPGTPETFNVKNLAGGTQFYFAIRSLDFEGNISALSNVVSETSALTPSVVVTPLAIVENLETAGQSTRTFTISNEGEGSLKFTIQPSGGRDLFAEAAPLEGQLSPGKAQAISVNFDASEKFAGSYQQDIIVMTNDPQQNTVTVHLTLHVTNNDAPIASLESGTADFKSVQVGQTLYRKLNIYNAGSRALIIDEISSSHAVFHADAALPITIEAFERTDIRIAFSPTASGLITGQMILHTNDPDHAQVAVQLTGEGIHEAPLSVSPASFNETVAKGSTVTKTLTLRNNGSQDRRYRVQAMNYRLATDENTSAPHAAAREKRVTSDTARMARTRRLQKHQEKMAAQSEDARIFVKPLGASGRVTKNPDATGRISYDKSPAVERDLRKYVTGFEEFTTGPVAEQHGWFTTQGWTIAEENAAAGIKHFRGNSQVSGTGEKFALSPYLFEYEEFYYPQYTSTSLRLNLDKARGTTWEVVPQDPWSYVATRIRFNADGTIDALVIDNDYASHWRRVPAAVPSGYFDLAIEYNNAGSDTSGFPTYYLFIDNQHVFSGTGLASGIGQVAFVSAMETTGPVIDVDDVKIVGAEYLPPFIKPSPAEGIVPAGESVNVAVEFDASIMKFGIYESELVVYLDEIDSVVVPVSLTIPGEPSLFRDVHALFMVLEKQEEGRHDITLRNTGGQPIDFSFETDVPGLTIRPESGSLNIREEEVIEIRFNGAPGIYEDRIIFRSSAGSAPEAIPVTVIKLDSGAVFQAPEEITLDVPAGRISTQNIQLRNDGINTVSFTTEVSANLDSVMTLDPPNGTITDDPIDLALTIDTRNLSPSTQDSWIQYATNDGDSRKVYTTIKLNILADTTQGRIAREVWTGIPGTKISSIPLNTAASVTEVLTKFEAPANTGDNYGARIRGYVQAPATGSYTFWIASNDNSELWLSLDEDPANKRKIASVTGYTNPGQWNKYTSQVSQPVNLQANRKYYIEALHKEGVGTDHVAVGWRLPNQALERPIPGLRLLPYGIDLNNDPPQVMIASPTEGASFSAPATIDIRASVNDEDGRVVKVDFYNGTEKIGTDISVPYSFTWKNVPVGNYSIVVKAMDNSGAMDSAVANIMVTHDNVCAEAGHIMREQWNGISGNLVSSIPVNTEPAFTETLRLFESPPNIRDNYGARIRGYLCVPVSGHYSFWIASNDNSELWLSTDASPSNKSRIAYIQGYTNERQWNKFANQKSTPVYLESGKKYYIEALHKEGIGTDHLAVGWQLPDGTLERPLPGMRLMPFESSGNLAPVVNITSPEDGAMFSAPATIEISAQATDEDGEPEKVVFYNGTDKLGEDTSAPFSFSWAGVPEGSYSLTAVAFDNSGLSSTSTPVNINVQATCVASGTILREYWAGISGNLVSSIPVNTTPDGTQELTMFEAPANVGTNYGARISGYICPPATGEYYFWIASNDNSELWLSTGANPANKNRIAFLTAATGPREWQKFSSQRSAPILLTQGKTYYIEALHKQGIGTDHIAVGWQLPDGTLERPIAGSRLSPMNQYADARNASARLLPSGNDENISVEVYPNPVRGEKLRVHVNSFRQAENSVGEIVIRQLTGLPVYSEKMNCSEGCSTEIDVPNTFIPGIYILQVKTDTGTYTEKLIVP